MTFAKAKQKDHANSESSPLKPCSECQRMTKQEVLVKYGSFCEACFESYCRRTPAYVFDFDKYKGHPRAWALRIIDKHEAGIFVNQIALKMAREAV